MMPEWIQHEGIDAVLKNLIDRAKATAVAISGKVRLLDRSLWGKRELFVRAVPSFTPDVRLYQGLCYQPAAVEDLTRRQGPIIADFIRAASSKSCSSRHSPSGSILPMKAGAHDSPTGCLRNSMCRIRWERGRRRARFGKRRLVL